MPINHDEATASIYVTGLSLGCVNSHTKKWEVCFIDEPGHNLGMKVTKMTAAGEDERPAECPDYRPIAHGSRIVIEDSNPVATSTTLYKPSPAGSDAEDFHSPPKGDGAVCNYTHLGNMDWMFPLPVA
ncbi:MAG: hypothetical protein ABW250_24320 [Pyrinomonadaceae bacterium]